MLYQVEVCRTGCGTTTLEVEAATAGDAASKAIDAAGGVLFSEHHSEYEVNNVVDPQTKRSLDFSEPIAGTIGDLIDTMPLFRNIEWDADVLAIELNSVVGRDCADVLTKGNALASVCADVDTEIMEAVVRQVNVFFFG